MSIVITLDGPASAGKSSVGQAFAEKIGFLFIDTGTMYRAGAKKVLDDGVDLSDEKAVAKVYQDLNLRFETIDHKTRLFLDGKDVTDELRDPQISLVTSMVSAYPEVREVNKQLQRRIGEQQDTVMAGRDIGSEIFPDAKLKLFLTARPEIRAMRRFKQLQEKDPELTYIRVYTEMMQRDEQDSNREASPMRIAENAVVIDNSDHEVSDTIKEMEDHFRQAYS